MLTAHFTVYRENAHTSSPRNPSSLQYSPLPFNSQLFLEPITWHSDIKNSSFKLGGNKEKTTRTLCFTNVRMMSQANQEFCPSLFVQPVRGRSRVRTQISQFPGHSLTPLSDFKLFFFFNGCLHSEIHYLQLWHNFKRCKFLICFCCL